VKPENTSMRVTMKCGNSDRAAIAYGSEYCVSSNPNPRLIVTNTRDI
jgi:hypothetical protein